MACAGYFSIRDFLLSVPSLPPAATGKRTPGTASGPVMDRSAGAIEGVVVSVSNPDLPPALALSTLKAS